MHVLSWWRDAKFSMRGVREFGSILAMLMDKANFADRNGVRSAEEQEVFEALRTVMSVSTVEGSVRRAPQHQRWHSPQSAGTPGSRMRRLAGVAT